MQGLMLAAPHSGAGKTLITMIILRGLQQRGIKLAPFKAGPDYIDPRLHQLACGCVSLNLDPWAMRTGLIEHLAGSAACEGNMLIVEAMMGLFDGALDGSATPADLARSLKLPIILIVDCTKISHSVAALVSGFHHFADNVSLGGLILNKVGSPKHEKMLRQALSKLDIPILGVIARNEKLVMKARHLGLTLPDDPSQFTDFMEEASHLVEPQIKWSQLEKLANSAPFIFPPIPQLPCIAPLGKNIAIARDSAFCFTYPHILSQWQQAGSQLSFFSPLHDESPPFHADSIYLPGGYPELYAEKLATNKNFQNGMRQAAMAGKRVYGECGGFMVLGEGLEDRQGTMHTMLGLLPLTTSFKMPHLQLGYRKLQNLGDFPLPEQMRGHEFHYSHIIKQGEATPLFQMYDALGENLGTSGLVRDCVAGSFIHLIDQV